VHVIPFTPDIDLTAEEIKMYATPWMSPSLVCMSGIEKCGVEKHIIIIYEWPMATVNSSQKLSKYDKECLHLERFNTDINLELGTKRIDKYEPGEDPPDFIVYRDGKSIRLDLVQFTFSKRRRANAIFEKMKETISQCEPAAFAQLAGCIVYVNFGLDGKSGHALPFTNKEAAFAQKFISNLSEFEVDRSKWQQGKLPEKLPELNEGSSDGEAGFLVAPMSNAVPGTTFFYRMGFELGLAYYTRFSAADAWNEIHDRVESHDKKEIEEILISAGAPNESGVSFPSDEALILHALKNPPSSNPISPKYVKGVLVHIWSTGAIWEIYPNLEELSQGIYKGVSPVHHVIIENNP
jgi:hypothetical protein